MSSIDAAFERLETLSAAANTTELFEIFENIIRDYGVRGYSTGNFEASGPSLNYHHRSYRGWMEHYNENSYFDHCAATQRLLATSAPFRFEALRQSPNLTKMNVQVLDEALAFDRKFGLLVPVHVRGVSRGWVTFVSDESNTDPQVDLILTMLAMSFHSELRIAGRWSADDAITLTPRESEILKWLAVGKTTSDVGDILGISDATVLFHYQNAARKYGTQSRTQTVIEAMRRGAIRLD